MTKESPYRYRECGLDNIFLLNGYTIDDDGTLHIINIHDLHKSIAENIILSSTRIKGREIRYLRHYLDFSQKVLGDVLQVDYQSVHRWETGKAKITKTTERLLRAIVYEYINGNGRIADLINRLSDLDNNRPVDKSEYTHTEAGWTKAA